MQVKDHGFHPVEGVSLDEQYLPSKKGAFMAEMQHQGFDMHYVREGLGYDLHRLQTGYKLATNWHCPAS